MVDYLTMIHYYDKLTTVKLGIAPVDILLYLSSGMQTTKWDGSKRTRLVSGNRAGLSTKNCNEQEVSSGDGREGKKEQNPQG